MEKILKNEVFGSAISLPYLSKTYRMIRYLYRKSSHLIWRRRLQTRLGMGIAGLALLFSTLSSLSVSYSIGQHIQAERGQSLAELSHYLTQRLDRGMFERYREIEIVSSIETIRNPKAPLLEKRSLLEKLQITHPHYAWIGLTDPQGHIVASTGGILEGKDISKRPVFEQAKSKPFVGDVHEAVLLAKLLPNPTGEPMRFVDVAAPVTDEGGKSLGVVAAHLSWNWAKEVQASLLEPIHKRSQVEVLILSKNGTVLLGPPKLQFRHPTLKSIQAALTQNHSYHVETWADGKTYLSGFARTEGLSTYPGLGWIVLVRQPTAIAFAPAWTIQQQIFLAGLVLGGLFAGLSWIAIERITRPLLDITASADRIRRGDRVKIPVLPGKDELARLSRSLNKLVSKLTAHEQALLVANEQLRRELLERQQAELSLRESEERFRQIAENIREVFWMASGDVRQVLYISPVYEEIFRRPCHLLYENPTSCLEAIHPEDRRLVMRSLGRHKRGEHEFNERFRIVRPDGSVRWVWSMAFPVKDELETVYRHTGVLVDITEQVRAEELEREKATLETEIICRRETEAETRVALEKEKELGELKSRFIAMTSHEFRTPLTTILSSTELLENYSHKLTTEKKQQHFKRIKTATQRMVQLLEDVLLIGKAEAGKLTFNPSSLNLSQFCNELVEEVRLSGSQHNIDFVVGTLEQSTTNEAAPTACLDKKLLQHILSNLLSNATKYSPIGSTVYFELSFHRKEVVFKIQDQGIGIPEDDQKHLFETFHRAKNVGTIPGTGLGLAIVKRMVDLHGGQIAVESAVAAGTMFTVTLPLVSDKCLSRK